LKEKYAFSTADRFVWRMHISSILYIYFFFHALRISR